MGPVGRLSPGTKCPKRVARVGSLALAGEPCGWAPAIPIRRCDGLVMVGALLRLMVYLLLGISVESRVRVTVRNLPTRLRKCVIVLGRATVGHRLGKLLSCRSVLVKALASRDSIPTCRVVGAGVRVGPSRLPSLRSVLEVLIMTLVIVVWVSGTTLSVRLRMYRLHVTLTRPVPQLSREQCGTRSPTAREVLWDVWFNIPRLLRVLRV